MIALDTNLLVRFLVNDDEVQGRAARELVAGLSMHNPGFICREVSLEVAWVLDRAYGFPQQEIAQTFENLIASAELEFEAAQDVARSANNLREGGSSFADQMIAAAARRRGASEVLTFDRKAARNIDGFRLIDQDADAWELRESGTPT